MKIIKLNAIGSTNTFLKEMCNAAEVDNYTVVIAENQIKGRGQMASGWMSEAGKNLTFSILIKLISLDISMQFYISKIISLAINDVLKSILSMPISIKWPNDILTEGKKVCGILIENSVKRTEIQHSIVGIGLNVNQEVFENLPNATSMKIISGKEYNLNIVLNQVVDSIKRYCKLINEKKFELIDELYLKYLFRYMTPTMLRNTLTGQLFMGIIVGVAINGRLQVKSENEILHEFNLKEVEFLN